MGSTRDYLESLLGSAEDERDDVRRVLAALAACLSVGLCVWMARSTHLTDPAALMTLRYAENIAHGEGFVYNPGERVLGTTTPLLTLLMALGIKLGFHGLTVAKALGILAAGALCLVMNAWLRAVGRRDAGVIAAFLIAASPNMIHWAIAGMETTLVVLFSTAAWLAFTTRRYVLAGGILGVLFLLRWDTILVAGMVMAAAVLRERRVPIRGLALFALVIAPWLIFAALYFGNPIPVTVWAKEAVSARARALHPFSIRAMLPLFIATRWDMAITAAAAAGVVVVARERLKLLWPAVVWCALYWVAYIASRMPVSDRYALPALPVHVALASISAAALLARAPQRWSRVLRPALGGVLLIAVLVPLRSWQRLFRNHQDEDRRVKAGLGAWLGERGELSDRVMVGESSSVGYFGYYSRRTMIDAKGTVTPVTIPFWSLDHASPNYDIAAALRPEWCVLQVAELPGIRHAAQATGRPWDDDYERVEGIPRDARGVYEVYHRRGGAGR